MKKRLLILLCAAILSAGCSTITPNTINSDAASPNHSNIYAHAFAKDGSIADQWWQEEKRDKYNAYIALYGKQFAIPLEPDTHLTKEGSLWKADATAIEYFTEINQQWKKS